MALKSRVPTETHILNILHRPMEDKPPPPAPVTAPPALKLVSRPLAPGRHIAGIVQSFRAMLLPGETCPTPFLVEGRESQHDGIAPQFSKQALTPACSMRPRRWIGSMSPSHSASARLLETGGKPTSGNVGSLMRISLSRNDGNWLKQPNHSVTSPPEFFGLRD